MNHETLESIAKRRKPFTVDYTGFGWLLIKNGVFEHDDMKYPWFAPKMQVFESGEVQDMCGEDVSFCLDAISAGFEIWCDPRIRVGHEKTRVIWSMDRYTVKRNGKVLFENMSELDYMELMQDLAIEYYKTGSPKAGDIETFIIGENDEWQKQKQVWTRAVMCSASPKKLVKERVRVQNTRLARVTRLVNLIVGKDDNI